MRKKALGFGKLFCVVYYWRALSKLTLELELVERHWEIFAASGRCIKLFRLITDSLDVLARECQLYSSAFFLDK